MASHNFLASCEKNRASTEHWSKKLKPLRSELFPGSLNAVAPLVERSEIVFPPPHIKLGIMKQFVKVLEKDGDCVKYLYEISRPNHRQIKSW